MPTVHEVVDQAIQDRVLPPGTPADTAFVNRIITSVMADIFFTMGVRPFVADIYVNEPVRLIPEMDMTWDVLLDDADENIEAMADCAEKQFLGKLLILRSNLAKASQDGTGSGPAEGA